MSPRFGNFGLRNIWWKQLLRDWVNWGGGLVLERQDPTPVHVEGLRKLLPVGLSRGGVHYWVLFVFPPLGKHVVGIIEVHSRPIGNKSVQLISNTQFGSETRNKRHAKVLPSSLRKSSYKRINLVRWSGFRISLVFSTSVSWQPNQRRHQDLTDKILNIIYNKRQQDFQEKSKSETVRYCVI